MHGDLGSWEALDLASVVDVFAGWNHPWWVSGGHALELFAGRSWRAHDDTDISCLRRDASALRAVLAHWDIHVASGGVLTPWDGGPLAADRRQNNLWCRRRPGGPWEIDITISDGDDDAWVFRRDPSLRVAWPEAQPVTPRGVRYLAPHLQLLFKSRDPRPKDDIDAAVVIPLLDTAQREWLAGRLAIDHPWQEFLSLS